MSVYDEMYGALDDTNPLSPLTRISVANSSFSLDPRQEQTFRKLCRQLFLNAIELELESNHIAEFLFIINKEMEDNLEASFPQSFTTGLFQSGVLQYSEKTYETTRKITEYILKNINLDYQELLRRVANLHEGGSNTLSKLIIKRLLEI